MATLLVRIQSVDLILNKFKKFSPDDGPQRPATPARGRHALFLRPPVGRRRARSSVITYKLHVKTDAIGPKRRKLAILSKIDYGLHRG